MARAQRNAKGATTRRLEPYEMTAEQLQTAVEAMTGLPMPEASSGPDYYRWCILATTNVFVGDGIPPEDALRLASLDLLAQHGERRRTDVEAVYSEAMGHVPEGADWQDARNVSALIVAEYEWLRAIS